MKLHFEKIIPEDNCFRFYTITSEPDLFEEASLVIRWGRIGHPGRQLIRGSGSAAEVTGMAGRLAEIRKRRGYVEQIRTG